MFNNCGICTETKLSPHFNIYSININRIKCQLTNFTNSKKKKINTLFIVKKKKKSTTLQKEWNNHGYSIEWSHYPSRKKYWNIMTSHTHDLGQLKKNLGGRITEIRMVERRNDGEACVETRNGRTKRSALCWGHPTTITDVFFSHTKE